MSQQHASVSQGRICSDTFTCCHTEIEVAHQTFHLTQSQYTDTGLTSPSTEPITLGAWQGSHWCLIHWYDSWGKRDLNPGSSALEVDTLTTRPTRRFCNWRTYITIHITNCDKSWQKQMLKKGQIQPSHLLHTIFHAGLYGWSQSYHPSMIVSIIIFLTFGSICAMEGSASAGHCMTLGGQSF